MAKDAIDYDMISNTLGTSADGGFKAVNMTTFGETTATNHSSLSTNHFFTGKPYIGELGYTFLFRDYRPEQGKWQTADPLGYPDGWNNLAYVNNWATMCIDWLGASVYDLVDKEGAKGFGHSAQVVTVPNANGTYTAHAYDYGPGKTGDDAKSSYTATTEEGARNAAVQGLDPEGNKYDNMTKWNSNDQQSQAAKGAMDDYVNDGYNPGYHNCRGTLTAGLAAAGYDEYTDYSPKTYPNEGRRDDLYLGGSDLTQALKNIQKGYAE